MATGPARARLAVVPTRHVYDVAVVGGQLGGAVAGALLARRGLKVLYLEHDGAGQGYAHDGWLLPWAPAPLPPLKVVAALEDSLVELGVATEAHRVARSPQPGLQLLLPDARVDLLPDGPRRAKELARGLGDDAAPFGAALAKAAARADDTDAFFKAAPDFPPEGMWARWKTNRLVAKHPTLVEPQPLGDVGAQGLVRALAAFLHHAHGGGPLADSRPLGQLLHGAQIWPGAADGLRAFFVERLRGLGGDVLGADSGAVVEEITFDGGAAVGVKLVHHDQVYKASCVVAATDAAALRKLVPQKKRHRAVAEALDAPSARRLLFTLNVVLPERALPRGLGELALLSPQDAELGAVLLQVEPARRVGQDKPEPDAKVVCAACFVDANVRELGDDAQRAVAARLRAELDRVMPFALPQAQLESAPWLDAAAVRGGRLALHPHLAFDEPPLLGITGLPTHLPARGLYLASREVLPGLGLEGEVLAGRRVARQIQDALKKADPLEKL